MHHEIEFKRFKSPDALCYYLTFDGTGAITKATIYVDEMQKFIDITNFVANDDYWRGRVDEWLFEQKDSYKVRKFWKVD
jgi:hypothetical protein